MRKKQRREKSRPSELAPEMALKTFSGDITADQLAAITSALLSKFEQTHAITKRSYQNFPLAYPLGHNRHFDAQEAVLALDGLFPGISCKLHPHYGRGGRFAVIETAHVYMTLRRLKENVDEQTLPLFRREEQARQLRFRLGDEKLQANLCFGFHKAQPAKPLFVQVRFPNGNGGYIEGAVIDALALAEKVHVPEEKAPTAASADVREQIKTDEV